MPPQTARQPKRKPVSNVDQVMRDFRVTYADAVILNMTDAEWAEAAQTRRLTWQSRHRLSLADAVKCYRQMAHSYNAFDPSLLSDLNAAFGTDGIQVTPAREYSVAVYLHIPAVGNLRQRVETFAREHFSADDVGWVDAETLRLWWD